MVHMLCWTTSIHVPSAIGKIGIFESSYSDPASITIDILQSKPNFLMHYFFSDEKQ